MIRIRDIIKMQDPGQPADKKDLITESSNIDIVQRAKDIENRKEEARRLYEQGTQLVRAIFEKVRRGEVPESPPIADFIRQLVDSLLVDEGEYFSLFYELVSPEQYLYNHSVNVSILSVKIALWLGYNKSEVLEIATAAFLHDIGMNRVENIVYKKGRLDKKDRIKVNKHPLYSEEIVRKIDAFSEKVILAVAGHHYRGASSTYSAIPQIIGLADIYEAITHPRAYRQARLPHYAIREIIEKEASKFQPEIVKTLLNNLGIHPIGSWVKLSTGEIGIIVGTHKGYPLRPKVNIIFDSSLKHLNDVKILDMLTEPHIYIDSPVDLAKEQGLSSQLT